MDRILSQRFYERRPNIVARNLLGAILVRSLGDGQKLKCRIVETEAYFGPWDPASRASIHRKGRIVERLKGSPGLALVYGVHANWMLNAVAHPPREWGAVLIRSCEPLSRLSLEPVGPGRLTRALAIDRSLDGIPLYEPGPLYIVEGTPPRVIIRSHRIGVKRDLPAPYRFCDGSSKYLSRPC